MASTSSLTLDVDQDANLVSSVLVGSVADLIDGYAVSSSLVCRNVQNW